MCIRDRGAEYSRSISEIKEEVFSLTEQGVCEVTLLGQNVNSWHGEDTKGNQRGLAHLIYEISNIERIKRIRYTTSHPLDMDHDLVLAHKSIKKLMPYLHLPIQSGSDNVLKKIINEFYAGSEGNGFFACNSEEWLNHIGTVGKPIFGIPHICDEEGNELPIGAEGTIWFESDIEFTYHNDEKKTLETRHPKYKKWTTLGDIGKLDEDNYLYLTDRKAFMIISGGVNIYPQETEDLIITHPKVFDLSLIHI